MNTEDKIRVMQAYVDGEDVEYRAHGGKWNPLPPKPVWQWSCFEYRIKEKTPDYINWEHINPRLKWMARDFDGCTYVFEVKPKFHMGIWESESVGEEEFKRVDGVFASYEAGKVHAKDSLVKRPERK